MSKKRKDKMKISIIIPVKNNENTIRKCLESIKSQTIKPYEIIIVNNRSKDRTIEIIKSYYLTNIKIISCFYNNIGRVRNKAINKATGNYILFVDADDYIDNKLIETLNKYESYDLIRFQPIIIASGQKEYENKFVYKKKMYFNSGLEALEDFSINQLRYGVFWIYCIKKSMINKIFPFKIYEDTSTIPFIIEKCKKIINIDYYGYNHIVNQNGLSRTISLRKKEKYFQKTCNILLNKYQNNKIISNYYQYHLSRKIKK